MTNIQITSLSSTGEGIGSLEGMKVFVEGALPGETVSIQITQQKKTYAQAQLLSVLSAAPERIIPPCPLFGECGGCQIMHVHYEAQLSLKRERVVDALERIGRFQNPDVLPCIPSPESLGYRNKIQLPVVWEKGTKTIGLYRKQTHEIIPLDRCLIHCPQGGEVLASITQHLIDPSVRHVLIRSAIFQKEILLIFVTSGDSSKELKKFSLKLMETHPLIKGVVESIHNPNTCSDNVILGSRYRLLAGRPFIYETVLNKTFKISPSAFFQVNPAQTEKLYEKAITLAEIQPDEIVLDAYCGVGTLALFAADRAKYVYGVESVPHAIEDAIENARLNQQKNCSFVCGKAEERIHQFDRIDCIFLNPPRKGCAPELIDALIKKRPKKIIYISCDPATLARDLAKLHLTYQITTIQPFDMFPQTMHVETVVALTEK